MVNKIFITFALSLFLFSFVNAEGSIGMVKQYDCIDLYNFCPTCSYINLTSVQYPNGTNIIQNIGMTKTNNNYQYNFCDTSLLGTYSYTTCGDKDGSVDCEYISFEVTPSGFTWSVGFYILLLLLSIGIIILGYYVQDAWVVILGSFGMMLLGLLFLFYGIAGLKDPVYTWGIGIITLMLGAYFGVKGSLEKLGME